MAEIVQSLFGVSPESYQVAQQQRADQQAMQFAKLSPFEKASFGIGSGAYQLAGALGGALGAQDPELAKISARQQIARQLNPNDLGSIERGIAALSQAGDAQGAMMLQGEYRKLVESKALVGQREASATASLAQAGRERTQASPKEVQLAKEVALLSGEPNSPEYNTAYATSLREQMAPKEPKGPGFGTDREAVAAEIYDKTFDKLTQTQKAAVNKRVEEEGSRKAAAGAAKLVTPGTKELVDIPGFRAKVQATIDAPLKTLFAVENALPNIEDAIKTDNFASYRAAQTQFARAIAGAGDLSQKELKAAGADPALLGGAADYLSQLATSTPTKDTMQKMRSAMLTIQRVNTAKAQNEIDRQRKMAVQSGYPAAALDTALDFGLQAAPAGGGTIAEQAAAILKARQAATSGGR